MERLRTTNQPSIGSDTTADSVTTARLRGVLGMLSSVDVQDEHVIPSQRNTIDVAAEIRGLDTHTLQQKIDEKQTILKSTYRRNNS